MGALDAAEPAPIGPASAGPTLDDAGPLEATRSEATPSRRASSAPRPGARALLEVIDRDGHVRQAWPIREWPVRVGRALDNDVVLTDPHVAAHHFTIDRADDGPADGELVLEAGRTLNGVTIGSRRIGSGERLALTGGTHAADLVAGRTRLRLRLADSTLADELPLAELAVRRLRVGPTLAVGALLMAGLAFGTYLDTDPDNLTRALGNTLLAAFGGTAVWCGAWSLLSKTITRQGHFGWHLRVFLIASLVLLVLSAAPGLLAFSFSWPWLTDFSFTATFAVGAIALYFHLLGVEPARPRLLRWVIATGAAVGIALTLWFNLQRTSRIGEELYMSHLYPPSLRIARPLAADRFVDGLKPLHALLDRKAKESSGTESPANGPPTKAEDDDE